MGLKISIYLFFISTVFFAFVEFDKSKHEIKKIDAPSVEFRDAILQSVTANGLKSVLSAQKVYKYKDRDEFYESAYVTKQKQNKFTDTIYADKAVLRDDVLECFRNVKVTRNDFFALKTDKALYNSKNKYVQVDAKFEAVYHSHILRGSFMSISDNSNINVNNPHFEIGVGK
jgi:LPS export ABC transporter protein LptC